MHIAHFIPYLGRAQGGPVASLAQYAASLADLNCQVTVFTVSANSDGELMAFDPRVKVMADNSSRSGAFRSSRVLWQKAGQADFDLIHSHSLWTDVNRLAATLARRRHVPHLLAPCGTLARYALKRSWWKKWPVRIWFQWRALREAQCIHAKSEPEYSDIRRLGFTNPVAIIPNPVSLPSLSPQPSAPSGPLSSGPVVSSPVVSGQLSAPISQLPTSTLPPSERADSTILNPPSTSDFRRKHGIPPGKRILLYLGRLHPVKGYDNEP